MTVKELAQLGADMHKAQREYNAIPGNEYLKKAAALKQATDLKKQFEKALDELKRKEQSKLW